MSIPVIQKACRYTRDRDSVTIFQSGEGDLRLGVLSVSLSLSLSLSQSHVSTSHRHHYSSAHPIYRKRGREWSNGLRPERGWVLGKAGEGERGRCVVAYLVRKRALDRPRQKRETPSAPLGRSVSTQTCIQPRLLILTMLSFMLDGSPTRLHMLLLLQHEVPFDINKTSESINILNGCTGWPIWSRNTDC